MNENDINEENTIKKSDSKSIHINIYCCGDDYWELIRLRKEDIKMSEEFKNIIHPIYKWNYSLFNGISMDIATKIKGQIETQSKGKNKEDKNNIVICKIDQEIESNINMIISQMCKLHSENQPMVIFTIEANQTEVNIHKLIERKGYNYDYRDIFMVSCHNNRELHQCLFKICSYYNQLGDYYEFPFKLPNGEKIFQRKQTNYFYTLNIMLIGNSGTGKSAFLNQILGEKRALERNGLNETNVITMYRHDDYPLAFYDTPGIKSREDRDSIYQRILSYQDPSKLNAENILLVLYFINGTTVGYKEEETTFISELSKLQISLWFIVSHCDTEDKCNQKEKSIGQDLMTIISIPNPRVFAINNKKPILGYGRLLIKIQAEVNGLVQSNIVSVLITKRKVGFIIEAAVKVGHFLERYTNREIINYYMMASMSLKDNSLVSKAKMVKSICAYYSMEITLDEAYKLMDTFNWVNTLKKFATEINVHKNNELALDVNWVYNTIICIDNKSMINEQVFKSLYSRGLTLFSILIKERKPTSLQLIVLNVISLCIVVSCTNTYCNKTVAKSNEIDKLIKEDFYNAINALKLIAKKF